MTKERVKVAGGWVNICFWTVKDQQGRHLARGPWNEFTTDEHCMWTGSMREAQGMSDRLNIEALGKGEAKLEKPPPYYACSVAER